MWFSYGIWGPKSPPRPFNPKEEFVRNCEGGSHQNVPNVGSDNPAEWKCEKI